MDIQIYELIEGARQAEGTAVIIDVFRAFSLEAWLAGHGAGTIYAVGQEKTARRLKREHPDYILVGERFGKILPGFDYGNSPFQMKDVPLYTEENGAVNRRSIIHTTSAGTQGLVNAVNASEILTGSLLNAGAIADYIRRKNPEKVSLVAMGLRGKFSAPEDVLCARYIKSLLEGSPIDMRAELEILPESAESQKYFNPDTQDVYPREDYDICTQYDRFDLVLRVEKADEDVFRIERVQED